MDDLSGLDWTSTSGTNRNKPLTPVNGPSNYPSLRPTPPISGRSTPLSTYQGGQFKPTPPIASKTSTPANDSFSNLVSFGGGNPNKNLTLQEQQKRLLEEKARKEAERRKVAAADAQFWDNLGNRGQAPNPPSISPPTYSNSSAYGSQTLSNSINKPFQAIKQTDRSRSRTAASEEEDLFAAFNKDAPVDASTNFPIPQENDNNGFTNVDHTSSAQGKQRNARDTGHINAGGGLMGDDDDPFGLGRIPTRSTPQDLKNNEPGDDDVLGLLSKPVSEFARQKSPAAPVPDREPEPTGTSPKDRALAELVDMGFPAERASVALESTETGTDVQAAVGFLLTQAHAESRQKAGVSEDHASTSRSRRTDSSHRHRQEDPSMPTWMRQEGRSDSRRRQDSNSPATAEKDAAQYAAEIGQNLFKTANSLWKTGTKKMQQAVAELQHAESDPNQPKWMRDAAFDEPRTRGERSSSAAGRGEERGRRRGPADQKTSASSRDAKMTDEAMMLEAGGSRPQPRKPVQHREPSMSAPTDSRRIHTPVLPDRSRQQPSSAFNDLSRPDSFHSTPKGKISKQLVEEQTAQAYVSPARRRKPPKPVPAKTETNLLENSNIPPQQAKRPQPSSNSQPPTSSRPKPAVAQFSVKAKIPPRNVPPVSASSLAASAAQRQKGTDSFKRGDYPAAHISYTNALSPLPDQHPISIIVLCNRSLTSLKIGEPKAAIADADSAIAIIGSSKGEGESISLGANEPAKEMREFYGKALMRKAEALEHMEKWVDAAKVWREAVEAGHGGSTSIQGRNRCEKAAGIAPQPAKSAPRRPTPPKKVVPTKTSALDELSGRSTPAAVSSGAAVSRLREANAAAERADNEKFALMDQVDAKIAEWRNGKQDNLRALLGSLDTILWPEAGWKKVGMSELIIPGRVKVVYMKGIAKVHPDKISTNATTEQRMISGAVFSTLNEAWDKFKKENGL
ncbi:MAG: hypothetical protein M1834_004462 [Cirrosporium novae-zelandiae]|nr:MAG: hypothetical protein M1834_004462 [Cirrosporium novae-zelandiae]